MPFTKGVSGNPDTQFKPGESGSPTGKPVGTIHLSTHIQNALNDPNFDLWVSDPKLGYKKHEGLPVKAIVTVALTKAAAGDTKWADWLAKYGYGTKQEIAHTGAIATGASDPALAAEFADFLKAKTKE